MLRERRLRPIRQVIELIGSSGFSLAQLYDSIKAVAGFLNGLGIDKNKLVDLLGVLDLLKQFNAIEGPWTDEEALGERVKLALAIARLGAAVTGTERDDALVEQIDKYASDERVIAFLAMVLARLFARQDEAGTVGTLSLDDMEAASAEFKAQGFDPTILIQLLPYLIQLFEFFRKRRAAKPAGTVEVSVEAGVTPVDSLKVPAKKKGKTKKRSK